MKIVIEEIISQEFEVPDGTTFEEVRKMYKEQKLVLDNAEMQCVSVLMNDGESWQGIL